MRRKKLVKYVAWLVIVGAVGYSIFFLVRSTQPQGKDFSVAYAAQERVHIPEGAAHSPYNSNPPSSGPHYAQTIGGGFYDERLPDENVVHNLEHGDIWIAYRPGVSDEVKEMLKKFAGPFVVISPRQENEGDVSLVAWGRVDTFSAENEIDAERIRDFIRRYDNKGPEKVRNAPRVHGGV